MLVIERFDPAAGGLEAWTAGLARYLLEQGHEVHVAATSFAAPGIAVVPLRIARSDLPSGLAHNIERALAGAAVDVVHDVGYGWSADLFQPQVGSRVINLERDLRSRPRRARWRMLASPAFRRWRRDLALTERRQLTLAKRIVAVSETVRRDLAMRYDIAPREILVIRNGIDVARFSPALRERYREEARAALGIGHEVLFLAAAHNFQLKGLDTILNALAGLGPDHQARLVVAGNGAIAEYSAKARQLGVGHRVTFAGQVDSMPRLYAAADAFVHPTFHDACSLATLEALACGLPVITTRVNGAADGMQSAREGYVLEAPGNAEAVRAAMIALMAAEQRRACGVHARQLALANSFTANCAAIAAVYADIAAARRKTG
ncbi:MAG TPA: glycosyltransferase family 4 protein [Xanthobacteraceae bacterium]